MTSDMKEIWTEEEVLEYQMEGQFFGEITPKTKIGEVKILRKMCNQNELKVYDYVKENPKSIYEISKKTKIDYHGAYNYVKKLQKKKIIKLKKGRYEIAI